MARGCSHSRRASGRGGRLCEGAAVGAVWLRVGGRGRIGGKPLAPADLGWGVGGKRLAPAGLGVGRQNFVAMPYEGKRFAPARSGGRWSEASPLGASRSGVAGRRQAFRASRSAGRAAKPRRYPLEGKPPGRQPALTAVRLFGCRIAPAGGRPREGRPFRRRWRDSAAPRQRAKRGGSGSPLPYRRVSGVPHPLDPHPGRGLPGGRPPTTGGSGGGWPHCPQDRFCRVGGLRAGRRSGLGPFGCCARCPAPEEGARKDHP